MSSEPHHSEEGTGDTAEDGRVAIIVGGAPFEALPLVAAAIDVDTDLVRPRSAFTALDTLGFAFEGRAPVPHDYINRSRDAAAVTRTSSDSDPDDGATDARRNADVDDGDEGTADGDRAGGAVQVAPTMSVRLARSLQRHRGHWIAIRDNKLVGYAPTLGELRTKVGPGVVSVQFVPASQKATGE